MYLRFFLSLLLAPALLAQPARPAGPISTGSGSTTSDTNAKSWFDTFELVQLADPSAFGLTYKDTLALVEIDNTFSQQASKRKTLAWTLSPDVVASYKYHPKSHANLSTGFALKGYPTLGSGTPIIFEGQPGTVTPFAVGNPTFYRITLDGGLETAPVEPMGGGQDWKTNNKKLELAVAGFVPKSDILYGGLVVGLTGGYLDSNKTGTKKENNGSRYKVSALYRQPFPARIEGLVEYNYSWGTALNSDKHFYRLELSRSVRGTFLETIAKRVYGDKLVPRIFVRYYDGGEAPTYKKSHGFEAGIGSQLF